MSILIHDRMNRGRTQRGWLDSFHSFSFGGFRDPMRMGFGALRVINEDWIIPGAGFGRHDHAEMDILTIVLSGGLRHEDSLGNAAVITPGEVQLMQAGSGIAHSEKNASDTQTVHLLQIWLIPDRTGDAPRYQSAALPQGDGSWQVLASGVEGAAPLHLWSDTRVSIVSAQAGAVTTFPDGKNRQFFVQMVAGSALMQGEKLVEGDGLQVTRDTLPALEWQSDGQALLFDLAL
ncbi:pirin family protein [Pararhodobacter zhoushanensis]|uniref:Pirin family protein n=1 Tax=Pararhodobacter zhoushanensis TaxID=2479545 RepID=A0ABT3H026_9RHOB|nr:pirin-like bicupin family protein [Pararhodobacter zhoushanensis]MCW1933139.1 pirin family protein [Pararhodobacter zhoushanensis]